MRICSTIASGNVQLCMISLQRFPLCHARCRSRRRQGARRGARCRATAPSRVVADALGARQRGRAGGDGSDHPAPHPRGGVRRKTRPRSIREISRQRSRGVVRSCAAEVACGAGTAPASTSSTTRLLTLVARDRSRSR